ncbi:SDR family NAD(P)-dependent oxidoreductase, partial [Frankia sp. CcWB3]
MADETGRGNLARMGVAEIGVDAGCASFTADAPSAGSALVVCPVDWPRFGEVMASRRRRRLFDEVVPDDVCPGRSGRDAAAGAVAVTSGRAVLSGVPTGARPAAARDAVRGLLAGILGHAEARAVREDVGFFDLGLDSIMAVDLARELSGAFGIQVGISEIFDHPTVTELAGHLVARAAMPTTGGTPTATASAPLAATAVTAVTAVSAVPAGAVGHGNRPAADRGVTAGEPVAIVGMAGRFPGADSLDEYWELLRAGRDAVGPVPADRFDAASLHDDDPMRTGTITTDQGGFLRDIARFDAAFFDIPAREAESLDPQQRLLLESTWHALEDAAIDPKSLRGTHTEAFVGISNSDYARLLEGGGLEQLDAYFSTGTALNVAAGRIAYVLGLGGPALAVDTACSSSLVALHLAIRSLRQGETDCALAGGVNVIAAPSCSVAVSRAHMLSPEGRCKTFSADANGFVRAEGCGVLVLKRLVDARRDGDEVLAVLHGSDVNSDSASSGLTASSGRAQEAVITAALADAEVAGASISYLEAHGTGTALGDPIELAAAWAVLGRDRRPGEPLYLGSVKSNIGHCESASGIAGVIKAVLALRHSQLPANLHCATLNPHVPWAAMNVRVVDALTPWRAGPGGRLAAVSSFGFSGTNAQVILGEAPAGEAADTPTDPAGRAGTEPVLEPALLALSAADEAGLHRLSAAWEHHVADRADLDRADLAATAGSGRAHLPARRALLVRDRDELLAGLRTPVTAGPTRSPRVAFLFSGQGSQYFGMGRELYKTESVFREMIDSCDRVVAPMLGAGLPELMFSGTDRSLLNATRITQPALVALELALAALWESWGVTASVVIGHSVGEIAAAIHAGVMDRDAGLILITHRARLMQDTEPGGMLAVVAPPERVAELLTGTALDIAAINGPEAVVVAGAVAEIDGFAARMKELGITARPLVVSHAFHSRLMGPVLAPLRTAIAPLAFGAPRLPIIANLTGELAAPDTYDADYWCRHVREPVRFLQGARQLGVLEVDVCLEIGPDRTLGHLVRAAGCAPAGGAVPSLRRGGKDRAVVLAAARMLYEQGQDLAWSRVTAASGGRRGRAPHYPFAPTRYWTKVAGTTQAPRRPAGPAVRGPVPAQDRGPHWGSELRSPALTGRVFAFDRSSEFPPYLTDHRLYGTVVTPAASHLGTILSAIGGRGEPVTIEDLVCPRALVITEGERYDVQIVVSEPADAVGTSRLSVQSLVDVERGTWEEHLSGRLTRPAAIDVAAGMPQAQRAAFTAAADRHITGEAFYAYFRNLGYTLGPSFRWIADVWIREEESLIRYARPVLPDNPADYEIYPGLIDSCFQSIAGFMVDDDAGEAPSLAIPFAATRLSFPGRAPAGGPETGVGASRAHEELWGHVRVRAGEPLPHGRIRVESADLRMFTETGSLFVAEEFRVRHASRAVLERSLRDGAPSHAYALTWVPASRATGTPQAVAALPTPPTPPTPPHVPRTVAVLGTGREHARSLCDALETLGHQVRRWPDDTPADPAACDPAYDDVDLVVDARFDDLGAATGAGDALRAVLALAASLRALPPRIPVAVLGDGRRSAAPVREALWGMLAALEAEDPQRRLVRIGLDIGWTPTSLALALSEAADAGFDETRWVLAGDGVRLARLAPVEGAPVEAAAGGPLWEGGVLITGGLGALGLSATTILAGQGAKAITLMGRSGPDATAQRTIDELTASGVSVAVVTGDVTDPAACARGVAAAGALVPLHGVFHLAGVTVDGAFAHLTSADFEEVFAAKARGAETLAAAARGEPLRAFVLFSSVSSVLGSAGQANYAAANGYLDGLAEALRAGGMPATSVNWGPWVPSGKGGMAAAGPAVKAAERLGVRPLADTDAGPLLGLAVNAVTPRIVAVAADFTRFIEAAAGHPRAALVADLATRPRRNPHGPHGP